MLLKDTKSQGLSLNAIIIAAVVLIVLIVLWSIFTGRIGGFSAELEKCRGYCKTKEWCGEHGVEVFEGKEYCEKRQESSTTGGEVIILDDDDKWVCCVELR